MKKSKYLFLTIMIFAVITAAVHAQVHQDELQNLPQVIFINYEGPHAQIDTREQIRQLGAVLGRQISDRENGLASLLDEMSAEEKRNYSYEWSVGASNRYFVIHNVSGPEDGKLDADILGLGVDAGVDHIRNLRTIIQGYLQEAYDYSASDAALLAEYITIYNAVYRGNWDYFTGRYKTPVINNLTRERAGLSIRYDEWPGRTLIVIPLGQGGLSAVDTAVISDSRVVEELRREEDQGVPQRQDMVDLKEREAEQATQSAQTEREAIAQEQSQITDARSQVDQERQQIEDARSQADQERQQIADERKQVQDDLAAGRITEDEAKQKLDELDKREQALDQQAQALDDREQAAADADQDLDSRQQDVDQRSADAQSLEDFADQKTDEAQQDRESIATDQQAAITQQQTTADAVAAGVFGITIESENPVMGRLVLLDPTTGSEIRRSPVNVVHVKTVTFTGGKILAIAGEAKGSGAVRLIEIDKTTLEMAAQGNDDIKTGSMLRENGGSLYAITTDGTNCYIGRFDTNLALQAKSSVNVHQEATIVFNQNQLLTQRADGSVLILKADDLTAVF